MLADWSVKPIDNATAQELVVKNHYLHRKAPCSNAFGLFDEFQALRGVVLYGTPSSAPLRSGIAGKENANNVIELTRLWIDDNSPKNSESYLIGNSLKHCGKEIVVSFADTQQNHLGVVYQATNWLYTGLSAKRTDWVVEGIDKHGHTWADKYTAEEMRNQFGDKFKLVPRSRKHRYIFINAKGKRKKELLSSLKYKVEPYPKLQK
ncbi:hypothetical protein UFOVP419_17 [uncultured Caudovirales phage]|uniref:Uncharacterized protein n=1 Tax=uncultured Caudovirales phage TaxID=2100421 RepID=A0A6J5M826_9CAUD|nr:hypothetical protein UFOVP419_17 [uncultured Caudovirales phage]